MNFRKLSGMLSLAGGISALWDEVVGFVFQQLLDGVAGVQEMPEYVQNLVGLALLFLGIVLLFWPKIFAWFKGLMLEDAVTASGHKVFVNQNIDITKLTQQTIQDSIFVECNIFGDGLVHIGFRNNFDLTYEVTQLRNANTFYEIENHESPIPAGAITFNGCHFLRTRMRVSRIVTTKQEAMRLDPTFPPDIEMPRLTDGAKQTNND